MASRLDARRARIVAEYGFDFPPCFYRFWHFVNRLAPLAPLHALEESLQIRLVGPFEILAGRFDGRVPRHSLLLHWRYHDDPPEFFTVLAGGSDGLHWGYFLDDPPRPDGCVASYYARDAYEFSIDGDDLFEAVRLHLEQSQADLEIYVAEDPDEAVHYRGRLEQIARVRRLLLEYGTSDRPEQGDEYAERYGGISQRNDRRIARTREGMGIVAAKTQYRPLSLDDRRLWKQLRRNDQLPELVAQARQALSEGFPATALKLGKDLWAIGGKEASRAAAELLDAAYEALGRPLLRRVLQTHLACRQLPSVDILEQD
jgi:hypothetical protein